MRKKYIIDEEYKRIKLTFIKNWFMANDEIIFKLVETIFDENEGFRKPIEESTDCWGTLNTETGEISNYYLHNFSKDFIRKQWLKNKGDFLKSRK